MTPRRSRTTSNRKPSAKGLTSEIAQQDTDEPERARADGGLCGHNGKSLDEMRTRIAEQAYWLYEQRGRREGYALEDWLEAERLIRGQER